MLLGCIGDDFTGSSDIANTLTKGGMRVTQFNGVPSKPARADVEAGVVALKSRTAPKEEAVNTSLQAARWLLEQGCQQIFFKYCSTFDSTREGNIGPVADALADLLGEEKVIFCPAFPATGRSIYQGNLFVNDVLLHESSLKDHPLTPMTDSDLRRWLQYQTKAAVKHLPFDIVHQGAQSVRDFLASEEQGYFIADAVTDENLVELGTACIDRKLITGGSGLALGLPENFRRQGKMTDTRNHWKGIKGPGVIVSGSCSVATRAQVYEYAQDFPARELAATDILNGIVTVAELADWVCDQSEVPLVYTSADPQVVRDVQDELGQELVANTIEQFFGSLVRGLTERGVKRIVSAGGETSGAVIGALEIDAMEIGPEIAPGVPALRDPERELVLALKSGNFGGERFFEKALEVLAQ